MAIERESILDNRTIRVFISSTFQDMQDERSELIRKTFPRLRDLAAQRDVTLTEVDLRWGITKEESESGKVMEICLREVENSIPFFIGIIGNRYGWIPEQKDISGIVKERFPKVPKYVERHLSATEIEMQFGVLDRKDVDMNAYFFIKEEETSDIDDPERLAALKKAVRENKKYPVSTYKDPEDLADQVLAAYIKLLDDLFPVGELSALEKERLGQRAVLNNLSRVYIKTESNFAVIDKWMEDWEKHQLVITGASGLGKSALVANWIKEKLKIGEDLPYRIIYHFVGYGGSVGSDWHAVKALCDEIRDRYEFEADESEPKTDEKALDNLFKRVAVEGDKPLLIVLDGINQIIDVNYAKRLNWLPIPPRKVKILFTTLEEDETMQVFKDRNYPIFTLQPLTREERVTMVSTYLERTYSKSLSPAQLERIVDDPQNKNTLVLKTLLDEIANFGSYEKLDEKIEEYLKPDSISDFYQVVLKNYEADFGEDLVRHYLSLIAASRNGLSEDEILEIANLKDKPILWSQFFCSFRQHVVVRNGLVSFSHSYIREAVKNRYFGNNPDHFEFREELAEWEDACRKEIVSEFENQTTPEGKKTARSMEEVPEQLYLLDDLERLHAYLMDLDVFSYLYQTEVINLRIYWQTLIGKGGYSLEEYLAVVNQFDEYKRGSVFSQLNYFMCFLYIDWAKAYSVVGDSNKLLGKRHDALSAYLKAMEYEEKGLSILENLYKENHASITELYSRLFHTYNNICSAYRSLGNKELALMYAEKELVARRRFCGENHDDVGITYNNIGVLYLELGEYQKAKDYGEKALDIHRSNGDIDYFSIAHAYNIVGTAYACLGENKKALDCFLKAIELFTKVSGEYCYDNERLFNNSGAMYGRLGDTGKELEFRTKALAIARRLNHNDSIARFSYSIARAYKVAGQPEKARSHFRQAAEKYRELGDEEQAQASLEELDKC